MRRGAAIFFLFLQVYVCSAQENEPEPSTGIEQQIENDAEINDVESQDDSWLQLLEYYRKHPLNVNEANANDLSEFKLLSDLQIQNFISYKELLGDFIDIHELQAIPLWDISIIKKLRPYIIVANTKSVTQNLHERLLFGDNNLMFRVSIVLPKSKGFYRNDSSTNIYLGSRPQVLLRYKYNHKNLLQYGLLGDKDAGEQFLRGSQKTGFDFYSFHFFVRKLGIVKSLAIGDFTVNIGQGLIHWQSLAFKKNASAISVKRQSDVLRPYSSSGEYNFHRGIGITLERRNWETTVFASVRKFSATIKDDSSQNQEEYISSVSKSGYHRSPSEIKDRHNLQFISAGAAIRYRTPKLNAGVSRIQYFFSKPFKASDEPYDQYAIEGKNWSNASFDYSYTFRNIHLFGEVAIDKNLRFATLNGIIASIDRFVDIAIIHRKIDKQYQSLFGNAFTESIMPANETGLYSGISIRPQPGLRIDAYADFYKFPWLLYRTDAPSYGADYLFQLTVSPDKHTELYVSFKKQSKQSNDSSGLPLSVIMDVPRRNLRYQITYRLNRELTLKNRAEMVWYEKEPEKKQYGFLAYLDINYNSPAVPVSGSARLQYFETDGYNSRLYAYENDVLYSFSIPAFFDRGCRWYLNMKTDVRKWMSSYKKTFDLEVGIKYGITYNLRSKKTGSELDEIQGKLHSDFKIQVLVSR